jgi:hypothetical protein
MVGTSLIDCRAIPFRVASISDIIRLVELRGMRVFPGSGLPRSWVALGDRTVSAEVTSVRYGRAGA